MPATASLCKHLGCGNRTYDPYCYAHRDRQSTAGSFDPEASPTVSNGLDHATTAEAWSDVSRVFPDMNDLVHPDEVRSQVVGTIRAAVSVEVYRRIVEIDVADPAERARRAEGIGLAIVNGLSVRPNTITDDEAAELASSSADSYGRGFEESAALASYGLRLTHEIGRKLKIETDPMGIPYSLDFPEYAHLVSNSLDFEALNQFRLELGNFSELVRRTTGRPPKNPTPLPKLVAATPAEIRQAQPAAAPDPYAVEDAAHRRAHDREDAYEDAVRAERAARIGAVGKVAGHLLGTLVGKITDADGSRAAAREAHRQGERDRAWDRYRDESTEYYRRQNRQERRRRGW